jgi:hypothetical protein
MEIEMKQFLAALALVAIFAAPAMAQSQPFGSAAYRPYNPARADTRDPNSAPLMHDRAPRTFTKDAAALANTSDPGSAPLMVDRPVHYRGRPNDPAATADTSDPG